MRYCNCPEQEHTMAYTGWTCSRAIHLSRLILMLGTTVMGLSPRREALFRIHLTGPSYLQIHIKHFVINSPYGPVPTVPFGSGFVELLIGCWSCCHRILLENSTCIVSLEAARSIRRSKDLVSAYSGIN